MTKRLAPLLPIIGVTAAAAWAATDPQGFSPNRWGYDVSAIDRSVRPGDDFDGYATP